eukprot:887420_1
MYNIPDYHIQAAEKWSAEGGTIGYVGIDGAGIIGMFCVKDTIRDESYDVIASLQQSGIEVVMVTGDGEGAAQAVGRELGLKNASIRSQLLPEDKLHFLSGLKESSAKKN